MKMTRAEILMAISAHKSLAGADLRNADLYDADLHGADLGDTCLDPAAPVPDATAALIVAGLEPDQDGMVVAWRTARSPVIGGPGYEPGREYVAPVFSIESSTACHPGLYVWPRAVVEYEYPGEPLVRVRFQVADCLAAGNKFRVRRFAVLATSTNDGGGETGRTAP